MAERCEPCNGNLTFDNAMFCLKTDSDTKRVAAEALFNFPASVFCSWARGSPDLGQGMLLQRASKQCAGGVDSLR